MPYRKKNSRAVFVVSYPSIELAKYPLKYGSLFSRRFLLDFFRPFYRVCPFVFPFLSMGKRNPLEFSRNITNLSHQSWCFPWDHRCIVRRKEEWTNLGRLFIKKFTKTLAPKRHTIRHDWSKICRWKNTNLLWTQRLSGCWSSLALT